MLAAADLRAFEHRTLPVVLECAGHRRADFDPAAPGLRWGAGAASEAHWTGVPLAAVLTAAGIADDGVEVVLRGADGEGSRGRCRWQRLSIRTRSWRSR